MYWDLDLVMQDIICYQFQIIWDDLVVDTILLQYYIPRKIGKFTQSDPRRDYPVMIWVIPNNLFDSFWLGIFFNMLMMLSGTNGNNPSYDFACI